MEDDMIRIAIAFAAFASLAAPVHAQTHHERNMHAPAETMPPPAPHHLSTGTNLPGVDDSATTGSTGDTTSEPGPDERCELPGTPENTNPTADLPTVQDTDPSCR
jgi:hypothetical protein